MCKLFLLDVICILSLFAAGIEKANALVEDAHYMTTENFSESDPTVVPSPNDLEIPEVLKKENLKSNRPWSVTDYSNQENAIGWNKEAFKVPQGLETQVNFWKDVYTKHNSWQGILHDSWYINKIYEVVDFEPIMSRDDLTPVQKHKQCQKLIKERKQYVRSVFEKIRRAKTDEGLVGDELRYFHMFDDVDENDKFYEASKNGRLRLQLGLKDYFIKGIFYSGRYIRHMEKIFKNEGLPIELTRLPFVESSFNLHARSKVGASGIWQFMRSSGRLYMKVNPLIDERNEPLAATKAAARMMRFNYKLLEEWPLAVTAYNHGPAGVARIVKKLGTKDLHKIIVNESARRFGFASANFYASFLAALQVESEASKYFGDVWWDNEITFEEVILENALPYKRLVELFQKNEDLVSFYNPQFSKSIRSGHQVIPAKSRLLVPANIVADFLEGIKPSKK